MSIIEQAKSWLEQDPDDETRVELEQLLSRVAKAEPSALTELHDRFSSRLAFGTAGLRGELGAGTNRMNRVLVIQAAAGLANWLSKTGATQPVVIGYDGRKNSKVFAEDSAEIIAGAGHKVILLPRLLPTPVLAFAVKHYNASAGIMVTASHNPPNDNGYKVYLGAAAGGGQIIPPVDSEISAEILKVAESDIRTLLRSESYEIAEEEVVSEFIRRTASIVPPQAAAVNWVYTAMHGVGWETLAGVLAESGYSQPVTVDEQLHPDPKFSTVAFPNPEEPGALDLAFALAEAKQSELIIANDPDADRLGVAIPSSAGWRRLSGNEVGMLLGWQIAKTLSEQGTLKTSDGSNKALAVSLVSSPALSKVAAKYELDYFETPTGFKWIGKIPNLAFGYEEALGYLVDPDKVSDKDGISASLLFLSLVSQLKAEGKTVSDQLAEFAKEFGFFSSDQVSIRVEDTSFIAAAMQKLRENPPAEIAGQAVLQYDDLLVPGAFEVPSDVLRFRLSDGSRVIFRPSGTEPKLKIYLDLELSLSDGKLPGAAEIAAKVEPIKAAVKALVGVN